MFLHPCFYYWLTLDCIKDIISSMSAVQYMGKFFPCHYVILPKELAKARFYIDPCEYRDIPLEDLIVCTLRNAIQGDAAVKKLCTFGCFADPRAPMNLEIFFARGYQYPVFSFLLRTGRDIWRDTGHKGTCKTILYIL